MNRIHLSVHRGPPDVHGPTTPRRGCRTSTPPPARRVGPRAPRPRPWFQKRSWRKRHDRSPHRRPGHRAVGDSLRHEPPPRAGMWLLITFLHERLSPCRSAHPRPAAVPCGSRTASSFGRERRVREPAKYPYTSSPARPAGGTTATCRSRRSRSRPRLQMSALLRLFLTSKAGFSSNRQAMQSRCRRSSGWTNGSCLAQQRTSQESFSGDYLEVGFWDTAISSPMAVTSAVRSSG